MQSNEQRWLADPDTVALLNAATAVAHAKFHVRVAKAALALEFVQHGRDLDELTADERQTYDQQKSHLNALMQQRSDFMLADFLDRLRS